MRSTFERFVCAHSFELVPSQKGTGAPSVQGWMRSYRNVMVWECPVTSWVVALCSLFLLQIFWVSFLSSMANKKEDSSSSSRLRLDPALAQKEL